ncbi:MAG: hypothetical protein GXO39_00985 [Thermotogae bacterium]|nr:hypothetical protein [Thermotogota bacterium]
MRCGVDEAGLGPRIGSLFVVGVAVVGDLGVIRESKKMFKRSLSSYAKVEALLLGALDRSGVRPKTAYDLWLSSVGLAYPELKRIALPVFAKSMEYPNFLLKKLIIFEARAKQLIKNRFILDANHLTKASLRLGCRRVISGMAGNRRNYDPFLPGWQKRKLPDGVAYERNGREILFLKDADDRFREVALASLFAKYFRELHMLAINWMVGFEGPIPVASGYPADPKTRSLAERLKTIGRHDLLRGEF